LTGIRRWAEIEARVPDVLVCGIDFDMLPRAAIMLRRENQMKKLFFAVVISTVALAVGPASAAMMSCTKDNMAKSVTMGGAMADGANKDAMMKEMGMANTAMSKGDMRGACKSYMRAQKMGVMKS
jgi:hypothetical protein